MKTKRFKHQHHQESNEIPTKKDSFDKRKSYSFISSESEKENEEGIKAIDYYSEEEIKEMIYIQRKSEEKQVGIIVFLILVLILPTIFYLMFAFVKMDIFWVINCGDGLRAYYLLFLIIFVLLYILFLLEKYTNSNK